MRTVTRNCCVYDSGAVESVAHNRTAAPCVNTMAACDTPDWAGVQRVRL